MTVIGGKARKEIAVESANGSYEKVQKKQH